jgi:hypothetical protein
MVRARGQSEGEGEKYFRYCAFRALFFAEWTPYPTARLHAVNELQSNSEFVYILYTCIF